MRALICAVLTFVLGQAALTQPRHDRKLEQAATAIIVESVGNLRGSFDFGVVPSMVGARDDGTIRPKKATPRVAPRVTSGVAPRAPLPPGMARATERLPPSSLF